MKKALQVTTAVLALIPIITGAIGFMGVQDPLYVQAGVNAVVVLDSNLRFFSGVWLGLGLAVIWLIPRIDAQTAMFRTIWLMIFLGGIGRLISIIQWGLVPSPLGIPFAAFTVLEVIGAPLIVMWQSAVARQNTIV